MDGHYLYFYDANGNVGQLINASDGAFAAHYAYDAFGNILNAAGPEAEGNPFRFSTKYHDDETGLVYYGYRYYSPELGRWISRDPIGEDGGMNLYGFANGNPANFIDPKGLDLLNDIIAGIEGHGPLTEEVDITDIFDDRFSKIITSFEEAYNACVYCTVKCTLGVALPSGISSTVLREILKSKAKSLAKASLKKAIPYYNVIDAIVTAGLLAECAINCQSKQ